MGGQAELSGPDLGAGVDAGSLQPGTKLLGHANGEPVLLARLGDDFVAIGATCTHYGGPLAEGLDRRRHVRCPWHHACFSLRTGEALRAPALSPVACWTGRTARRQSRRHRQGRARSAAPVHIRRARPVGRPRSVVIVGAGAAGSAAAEMLRRVGYDGRITIVDEDNGSPYDRPNLSKDYLAGNAPEEWIPLRPDGFYAEHKIDIVRGRATRDRHRRRDASTSTGASRSRTTRCSSRPAPSRFDSTCRATICRTCTPSARSPTAARSSTRPSAPSAPS